MIIYLSWKHVTIKLLFHTGGTLLYNQEDVIPDSCAKGIFYFLRMPFELLKSEIVYGCHRSGRPGQKSYFLSLVRSHSAHSIWRELSWRHRIRNPFLGPCVYFAVARQRERTGTRLVFSQPRSQGLFFSRRKQFGERKREPGNEVGIFSFQRGRPFKSDWHNLLS